MARGEQRHASGVHRSRWRRRLSWLPDVVVVCAVLFAFVAWHFDLGARWGLSAPDPLTQPAEVAPPAGLDLPALRPAPAVAEPLTGAQVSHAKVARAIGPLLRDSRLGKRVAVRVADLGTGRVVYDRFVGGSGAVAPASTMKLLTSVAALHTMGPATRFDTTVRRVPGTNRIVLVGGGDPLLASKPATSYPELADIVTLARRTAAELRKTGTTKVRLTYDDSLFSGSRFNAHWPDSYQSEGVVPPITALWVDEGRETHGPGFVADPSQSAARAFRSALVRQRVEVTRPLSRIAPKPSRVIAAVSSAPLGQIVSRLLLVSDNDAAEVVAHHVGLAAGRGGTFAGGVAGVRMALRQLGVPLTGAVIRDGSGLSREDRLQPATELGVLRAAAGPDHPTLRQVVTGLPVSGFTGSLTNRFDTGAEAGRGRVQAKTATLTGVHGLAGVATDLDGDVLGFVVIADRVPAAYDYFAQVRVDKVAAALGGCHCGT